MSDFKKITDILPLTFSESVLKSSQKQPAIRDCSLPAAQCLLRGLSGEESDLLYGNDQSPHIYIRILETPSDTPGNRRFWKRDDLESDGFGIGWLGKRDGLESDGFGIGWLV